MNRQKLIESLLEVSDRKPEDIPLDAQERIKLYRNLPSVEIDNNLLKEVDLRKQEKSDRSPL